ncbi:g13318 [Coccomyxa viridis]|uniref:G13318 protein n=1 Tax=Coccomyxa viridis TaxID=1274662 RepID=A0ABP1GH57_9CHLO
MPAFIPQQIDEIGDVQAVHLASSMRRCRIDVPSIGPVDTAYTEHGSRCPDRPPVVLLHGFDGSLLEFRRLIPELEAADLHTLAVDLAGWGFTCSKLFDAQPDLQLGPQQKSDHLYEFWKSKVQQPMVLLGTSLGSAIAVHFAREHPECVRAMVMSGPQVYVDGLGMMQKFPRFVAGWGVEVLRSIPLRNMANQMAYYDKQTLATEDAMRIGRLHTFLPGWKSANIAFMRGGGYSVSKDIPNIQQDTIIFWGADDEILEKENVKRFAQDLPKSRLIVVEQCGHCIHLERPREIVDGLLDFIPELRGAPQAKRSSVTAPAT